MSKTTKLFLIILILVLFFSLSFSAKSKSYSVILNEVMWGKDCDGEEWIELRNLSNESINLSGWIVDNAKSSGKVLEIENGKIPANGYFLICDNGSRKDYCDFYGTISLANNYEQNGRLILRKKNSIYDQTPLPSDSKWPAGKSKNISMGRVFKDNQPIDAWQDNNPPTPKGSGVLLQANADSSVISLSGEKITFNASKSKGNIKEYMWNFGDGSTAEGKVVSHRYDFAGKYIVSLSVSDGRNKKTDSVEVVIYSDSIFISEFSLNDKWIEVFNSSDYIQDVAGWGISDNKEKIKFKFSEGSFISPHSFIILPRSLIGSLVKKKGGTLFLFYPSGDVRQQINYKEFNGLVARKNNDYFYTKTETPGTENVISGNENVTEENIKNNVVDSKAVNSLDTEKKDPSSLDENTKKIGLSSQDQEVNSPKENNKINVKNLLSEVKNTKPLAVAVSGVALFSGIFGLGLVKLRRRLKEGTLPEKKIEVEIEE